ncbi:hypothetical protein J7E91_13065 [Streptomyces sp. ISL-99]|nr:hypothetical protein [Streptomyces sp. ISL-99]
MLRSHSSALIPAALRALAADPADDVLLICPGLVYRRDAIDRLHIGTPHQLDLWRVTRRPSRMTSADLDEMVTALLDGLLLGAPHRCEAWSQLKSWRRHRARNSRHRLWPGSAPDRTRKTCCSR